jgi:hypothetical protein
LLTEKEIFRRLEENRSKIRSLGVKRMGLFGSYIKNEQKKESDIDFLVEFERGKKTFDNYMELKIFLETLFNRKVDLLTKEAMKEEIKPFILKSVRYAKAM